MSQATLFPKKKAPPPVRVTYTLTAAGDATASHDISPLITQDSKNITVRY